MGNISLLVRRDPHVANEYLLVGHQHVHGVVDGLFLSNVPLIDLKDGCRLAAGLCVLLVEVVFELVDGHLVEILALLDVLLDLAALVVQLVHVCNVEALAHEGVADLLDSIIVATSSAEDDKVGSLLDFILGVGLEVGEGKTACRAEKHLLHAFSFLVSDSASEEREASLATSSARILSIAISTCASGHGAIEAVDHGHEECDDLLIVALIVNVALDLINCVALLHYEVLARAHLVLDGVENHVVLLAQLLLNQLDMLVELGSITRLVDLDKVLVAGV